MNYLNYFYHKHFYDFYYKSIEICSVVGSAYCFIIAYNETRNVLIGDRIISVMSCMIYGYSYGFMIGLTSPVTIPIGLSIEIIKFVESAAKRVGI